MRLSCHWNGALATLLAAGTLAAGTLAGGLLAGGQGDSTGGRQSVQGSSSPEIDALVEEFRSGDVFFQERAEGDLRRRGAEGLPGLCRWLEDPDPRIRLRLWRIFRDLLRVSLDDLDSDAGALLRDLNEREAMKKLLAELPGQVSELRKAVEARREPIADPEEERRVAGELAEKGLRLRASEEALRDVGVKLPEIEARIPDRQKRTEEGRRRIIALGPAAYARIIVRRESALFELVKHYEGLLDSIRAGMPEDRMVPPDETFDRVRYLLSTVWAREVDGKGPLAAKAAVLLDRHLKAAVADLKSGDSHLRERAEEDLYALGPRGLEALLAGSAELPPGVLDRLKGLLEWKIEPGLETETGMDFRDYRNLPFRARRRLVIHYARVAGRAAIPTLRLIALDESREPSLRVRLAAAGALAGPNIRDRSAIAVLQEQAKDELLKIPGIAREFAIIIGRQLMEEKQYAQAVSEFRKVLDESPYDFQANYWVAFTYLLMKDYQKAILHFEIARRLQPADDLTLYNLACAYSLDGQADKALEALEAAAKVGFNDHRHMEADPDLKALRENPRFHELLERLKKN